MALLFRRPAALALLVGIAGCLAPNECPCGSSTTDPLSEHDLTFAGQHALDKGCVCQCGEDAPIAGDRKKNGSCEGHLDRCETAAGGEDTLSCY